MNLKSVKYAGVYLCISALVTKMKKKQKQRKNLLFVAVRVYKRVRMRKNEILEGRL
jgi:hypothetical protein